MQAAAVWDIGLPYQKLPGEGEGFVTVLELSVTVTQCLITFSRKDVLVVFGENLLHFSSVKVYQHNRSGFVFSSPLMTSYSP